MVKHKVVKFRWGTWKRLRNAIPGLKDEYFTDYLERVTKAIERRNE